MNLESGSLNLRNREREIPDVSEDVIQQGIRPTVKLLLESFSKQRLRPEVEKLHHTAMGGVDGLIGAKPNRVEILAIGGYFAEKVFSHFRTWQKHHPKELGSGRFLNQSFKAISYEEIEKMFAADTQKALPTLKKFTFDTLFAQEEELFYQLEDSIDRKHGDHLTNDERYFERYRKLLEASGFNQINNTNEPGLHVRSGLDTANGMTWAILEAAPKAFEETYERAPTVSELELLTKAGKEFVLFLSSLEEGIFSVVQEKVLSSITESNPQIEGMMLREKGSGFEFDIKPEYLRTIVERVREEPGEVNDERIHMGCPALAARGADGKNLVVELYDWLSSLAERFYYPRIAAAENRG